MDAPVRLGRKGRWTMAGIAFAIVAIFAAANTHLVYVSLSSEPDCVPHLKAPDHGGKTFRAAGSAC
ncbi:hypothetical protein HNP73_001524 [Amaricoccus macauensis]|uniref:Uncharacterized protein n=2 Tax=Amaricoccus macauensis TaxID=57001 RepID=A0A840SQG7_9RHOB|nr:hypothetical protein [Amaricoccus macauensis]